MMRTTTVDLLLDERARLIAQRAATDGHLYAAEFLLHRLGKLLPHLIADSAHNAVLRDVLQAEIEELLKEPRDHPGPSGEAVGDGEVPAASPGTEDVA